MDQGHQSVVGMSDPISALAQLQAITPRPSDFLNPRITHWSAGASDIRRPQSARDTWARLCADEAINSVLAPVVPWSEVPQHRLLTTALVYSEIATTLIRVADRLWEFDWAWFDVLRASEEWSQRRSQLADRIVVELRPSSLPLDPLDTKCSGFAGALESETGDR